MNKLVLLPFDNVHAEYINCIIHTHSYCKSQLTVPQLNAHSYSSKVGSTTAFCPSAKAFIVIAALGADAQPFVSFVTEQYE